MNIFQNPDSTHFVAEGEGAPVILLHGMAASLHDWVHLIPALTQAGYRAYALDLLGHGDSPKPHEPQKYRFDALYTHLVDWIESLALNQSPTLIGHSLGGYLSLKYALDHPQAVRGLVLVNPFYAHNQISPWLRLLNRRPALGARALQLTPERVIHSIASLEPTSRRYFPPQTRSRKAADYKRASPHILHIPNTVPDIFADLPTLKPPTLVIWGEKDLTLRPDSFPRLVDALPNARGYAVQWCGHQPHLGAPEAVNRVVLEFLESTIVDDNVSP